MTICVLLGMFYISAVARKEYSSTTEIALNSRQESVVEFQSIMSGLDSSFITLNTEVGILKSRELVGSLVDRLDLINDPEFNDRLRPDRDTPVAEAMRAAREALFGPKELPPLDPQALRDAVISKVLKAIKIDNIGASRIFEITAETWSPEKSARMADTLAELYVADQIELKFQATERATLWLTERVDVLRGELQTAERALNEHNVQAELVSAEQLEALNRQLKDFRARATDLKREAATIGARVELLESAAASGDAVAMAEAAGDAALSNMAIRLGQGQEQGQGGSREVFDRRFDQILTTARVEQVNFSTRLKALEQTIADLTAQYQRQASDLVIQQQLIREAESARVLYEYFLARLKETAVQEGAHRPDSRIISRAVVPLVPSKPIPALVLFMSALLGAMIGAVVVLVRDRQTSVFRSSVEVETATGLPVIGQIPRLPSSRRRKTLEYIVNRPNSAAAEAVRNMRTTLMLSSIEKSPQAIMLTSTVPGEGKTFQSMALAQNFAGTGRRTLLLDGDIRRRTMDSYFPVKDKPGLVSVVSGQSPLEEAVYRSDLLGIDVLLGEESSINAADFFNSAEFRDVFETLRARYDYIVVDTPPTLLVPDSRLIGQFVDAALYVVHWDKTPRPMVMQGITELLRVKVPVVGVVLNHIDPKGVQRYGYNDHFGQMSSKNAKYYQG